ncbi:hypothetical protein FKW77_000297 [Venturia effusa]|uniref:3-beta hydroxysteroid dehydrogenase/isomerase domain-containing protein n=1 Tax=Venturia effusa TaxID=50376 RepID=A0A517L2I7_9PEZI|nr:hypothetical protein FKW77_000297 [Venturia effusa]
MSFNYTDEQPSSQPRRRYISMTSDLDLNEHLRSEATKSPIKMNLASTSKLGPLLVTGGCGFLGYHLVKRLVEVDSESQIIVIDLSTNRNRVEEGKIEYIEGDISDEHRLQEIFHQWQPKTVFHTASPTPLRSSVELYERSTLRATQSLLRLSAEVGVQAFVFTASVAVLDDYRSAKIHGDDSMPLCDDSSAQSYAIYKARAEALVLQANSKSMKTASIRPSAIFGEMDEFSTLRFLTWAKGRGMRFQFGNGKNLRDFVHAANVADAHVLAAQKLLDELTNGTNEMMQVSGQSFIITNDQAMPFWEFIRKLGAAAGYSTGTVWSIPVSVVLGFVMMTEWYTYVVSFGRRRSFLERVNVLGSTWERTYSMKKAKDRLGFVPMVSLEEGIERSAKWFVSLQEAEQKKE